MTLLERDGLLAQLRAQWSCASAGAGRLLFVEGEAGIGKTTLLRAFAQSLQGEAAIHWGSCEALLTPRPLGALDDIAGPLQALLRDGADAHRVFVAFMNLLAERPALAVLEDVHWADEATLDLLRYAGRRVARTRSMLVASFRNDELVPSHPLRAVLGDLATSCALRVEPPALSLAGVQRLCRERDGVDAAELHARTAGNPFFVTEVLAAGGHGVPALVQDAVLARVSRLSSAARAVLDAAAVAGPRVEPSLLDALTGADSAAIDECLATGVLHADAASYAFRHELARQAVLQALTPTRATRLHRLALQALMAAPNPDAARMVHHADGALDAQAVRHWANAAALAAAARGAHRQAAEHLAVALKHTDAPHERAPLLDAYAREAQMSGSLDAAITAYREAVALWRAQARADRARAPTLAALAAPQGGAVRLGSGPAADRAPTLAALAAPQGGAVRLGSGPAADNAAISLAHLASLFVLAARNAEAEAALRDAHALIAPDAVTPAAYAVRLAEAGVRVLDRDSAEGLALATPVLEDAERRADHETMARCLMMIGIALFDAGRVDDGIAHLERCRAIAEATHHDRTVAQAFANLGSACGEMLMLEQAERYLQLGIAYGAERDLDAPRLYQVAWLALVRVLQGRWHEAADAAREVMGERRATTIARIMALIALGKLRARRGDPGAWTALDEARDLALRTGTVQRLAPMHAARAEAAWIEGRDEDAAREAAACLPLALAKRQAAFAAELLLWQRRGHAEVDVEIPAFCAQQPFALEAAGRWREAAQAWRARGCPFETARALADGDVNAQREALAAFEALGARPMVERVGRRLRAAGVRGLPRGPRSSTREHPAGLTSKEVAVLALLASGLRNKEIAARSSRSVRTIDHHVEAIFVKLGVATRAEAVSAAYRLGVVTARPAEFDS